MDYFISWVVELTGGLMTHFLTEDIKEVEKCLIIQESSVHTCHKLFLILFANE